MSAAPRRGLELNAGKPQRPATEPDKQKLADLPGSFYRFISTLNSQSTLVHRLSYVLLRGLKIVIKDYESMFDAFVLIDFIS